MNSLETSRIGLFPKPILILHLTLAMGWLGIAGCEKRMADKADALNAREELPAVDIDNDTTTPQKSFEDDTQGVSSQSSSSQHRSPDISDELATEFAESWVQAMIEGDGQTLQRLFDWNDLITRSLAGLELSEKTIKNLDSSFSSTSLVSRLVSNMGQQIGDGADYGLVRVVRRQGKTHVLFRLFSSNQGLNYHDIRLKRSGTQIVGDRLFVAISGEEFADTLKTIIAPALQANTSLYAQLSGVQKKEMESLNQFKKMADSMRNGDPRRAIEIYNTLPKEFQDRKVVMLSLISAANLTGDDTVYQNAIERYTDNFPDDPSSGFVAIDLAILKNDAVQLRRSYDSIKKWTGGDPFLDLLIGSAFCQMGQVDEGVEMTRSIDPKSLPIAAAHDFKLSIALASKDHDTVLTNLRTMRDEYGYEFSDLREAEGFEEFVKSGQFQTWLTELH